MTPVEINSPRDEAVNLLQSNATEPAAMQRAAAWAIVALADALLEAVTRVLDALEREAGARMIRVEGYCPMGCGATLAVGDDGKLFCTSMSHCPDPDRLHKLVCDPETEHIVDTNDERWFIVHPLRERVGEIADCPLHNYLRACETPPVPTPGRYRATPEGDGSWSFETL